MTDVDASKLSGARRAQRSALLQGFVLGLKARPDFVRQCPVGAPFLRVVHLEEAEQQRVVVGRALFGQVGLCERAVAPPVLYALRPLAFASWRSLKGG